jgi:hypothetical protein
MGKRMTMTPEIIGETEIARRLGEFGKIRHAHEQLHAIHRAISGARAEVKQSRFEIEDRRRLYPHIVIKPNPLPVISIIGPSGASKSHIIKTYMEDFCAKENWPEGARRVIDFELSIDATKRQFQVDALTALGDPDPEKGTEPVLRRRVLKLSDGQETELAFTDEVQHFIESDTQKKAKSVADAMKKTVNSGAFALVLLGTENASHIFEANQEFAQRVSTRFELRGVKEDVPEEADLFINFLKTFRKGIEEREVIGSAKTLESAETIGNLFTQAGGRLGTAQRIMKAALRVALERGASTLLPGHFAIAIKRGNLLFDLDRNVFEEYADFLDDENE